MSYNLYSFNMNNFSFLKNSNKIIIIILIKLQLFMKVISQSIPRILNLSKDLYCSYLLTKRGYLSII